MNEIDAARVPGRRIGEGMRGGSKLVSAASCVGGGFFPFSFAALSICFHFAFDWLSFDFFPRSVPGGAAGFGSWTVCTIRGMAAPLGRGRGADSQAGMPVRPAVGRARPWGGSGDAPGRIRRRRSLKPRKRLRVTSYTGDRFREGSMRRHRDYLVSALVFSVSLMSK